MLDRVLAPYAKWGLLPLRLMSATVGAECEMTLCAACLTLALLGAGAPSIDGMRNRGRA